MNLRYYNNDSTLIAQLANLAHEESNVIYNERIKTEHAAYVIFYDIFNQRFADLILQECIESARTVGGNAGIEMETIIKDKFGIEE